MPKVSIVVPIYKSEKYIERCARSLFNQTLDNIEFIFIDDCSPDQSIKILDNIIEEYKTKIERNNWVVQVEKMSVNSGQAAVRQYGIHVATGDYIIHCDSDDWIEEGMINEMWSLANKDDLDVVICDFTHIKGDDIVCYQGMKSNEKNNVINQILGFQASWALWNKMFRHSLYQRIQLPQDGMNMGEDMAIVVQLLYYCKKVGYINKALYNYRNNAESITNQKTVWAIYNNFIQWYGNICLLLSYFKNRDIDEKTKGQLNFWVAYAINDVYMSLVNTGHAGYSILFRLTQKVLNSPYISWYGKKQYLICMNRRFLTSLRCRLFK